MVPGWVNISIAGHDVDIFEPSSGSPRFTLLYLHAVGQESLAENAVFTAQLEKHRLACVAPRGGRSWWADRICSEFDDSITPERFILDSLVPYIRERWTAAIIGAFGISMGGQGAIRLGFKYPTLFPVVAGIASAFDYHEWYGQGSPIDEMYRTKEACRQDTAILHIKPNQYPSHLWFACDPHDALWFRGNDRLHEKLQAIGIPHVVDLTTERGEHSWEYFEHMAEPCIQFLVDSLHKQSRRLM